MTAPTRRPTVEGRDGDGPVRVDAEVLARRREGAYWTLSLAAPAIADRARPGQFVNVATQAQGALLRRPFSIYRVSRGGVGTSTVEVVFSAHGPGTTWLCELDVHDVVDVVGPLGSAFPIPRKQVPCLLVGGGYGVAPLFFLADRLSSEGFRVDMIAGAADQSRLFNTIEAKRMTASATFTTEDGSFGVEGRVTDVLEDIAVREHGGGRGDGGGRPQQDAGKRDGKGATGVIYACGPMPMLRAVAEQAVELGIPSQVAVEEHMACGVGVCWTCVVPVRTRQGELRMKRACLDGPVFNGAAIAWEESRWGDGPAPEPAEPSQQDGSANPAEPEGAEDV